MTPSKETAQAATSRVSGSSDAPEIVKWYTRARRFPQLIGKTPDGATIWGGPYTYSQVIAGVVCVVIGSKTTWLWGHFGLVGNAMILLGVAYGVVLLIGRLPIGSRNPLSVGSGVLRAVGSPAQGHLGGSPLRIRPPHRARSRVVIGPTPTRTEDAANTEPPASTTRSRRRGPRPRWSRPAPSQQPIATPPPTVRPTPASTRTAPALTGVQRLLASSGAPSQEN